jgi:hypothetical protein
MQIALFEHPESLEKPFRLRPTQSKNDNEGNGQAGAAFGC